MFFFNTFNNYKVNSLTVQFFKIQTVHISEKKHKLFKGVNKWFSTFA